MTRLILALALLALPVSAWGFSDNPQLASADTILSGGLRVNNPPVGDVLRCPSGICQFILHRTFPVEATSPSVNVTIRRYSPDGSPSGNVGDYVCLEVVKATVPPSQNPMDGTNFIASNNGNCSAVVQFAATNNLVKTNLLSMIPVDTTGLPCTGTACNGGDLYILVIRNAGGSTNNIDYVSMTLEYQ